MDTSKDKHFRKTFGLPRKGNSAIRITAPKTKSRQPALSRLRSLLVLSHKILSLRACPSQVLPPVELVTLLHSRLMKHTASRKRV